MSYTLVKLKAEIIQCEPSISALPVKHSQMAPFEVLGNFSVIASMEAT